MAPLEIWGRGQRILWPRLNYGQIFTKIDLKLMVICEKTINFLKWSENSKCKDLRYINIFHTIKNNKITKQ